MSVRLTRRQLLGAGGGLVVAFTIPACGSDAKAPAADLANNAWLTLKPDGSATIVATHPEIGQGVKTALPMIVAEELDMPWERVTVTQAPVDEATFGRQVAGGSTSIRNSWEPLRRAGATARALLRQAAAETWDVPVKDCETGNAQVTHQASGRSLDYGELAERASALTAPAESQIELKSPDQYQLVGTRIGGVDNRSIVTGQPLFGIDQDLPDLRFATYVRAPATGGTVAEANLADIQALPGVVDVFVLEPAQQPRGLRGGVAIVAETTWQALKARRQLQVEWNLDDASKDSWDALRSDGMRRAAQSGDTLFDDGNAERALASAQQQISASYVYPFLPHAPLEPQNCTASVTGRSAEIWAPSQTPARGASLAAEICGLDPAQVVMHQTRIGGGFGRRLYNDYVVEAVAISQRAGVPVKLTWTREDDMANDLYRPGGLHHLKGGLDKKGRLSAWHNHFVTVTSDGEKPSSSAGMRQGSFPQHLVKNYRVEQTLLPSAIPTGAWRAPGSNALAFVSNGFLHELSSSADRDHLEFLVELMGRDRQLSWRRGSGMDTGRAKAVLEAVGRQSNWGRPMPDGQGQGLAFYYSHRGYFAEVAEVTVEEKRLRVDRVFACGDVGPIINRSMAEHQVVGSVCDGLSTMMGLEITFTDGRVNETNFDRYPMMRMPSAPPVEVKFLEDNPSPTGLGEPALPPAAPAVVNAIFAATGERLRELPLTRAGWSWMA
ncbi:MAG: molybdopterin cofactor-binding domain-containing protein [Pseudomonadota bacterium]